MPQNVGLGAATGAVLPVGFNYALKPVAKVAQSLVNRYNQRRGLRELEKQLARGDNFSEVNVGNVDDRIATELNALRNTENVSPVNSSRVVVLADRVEHIYNQRVLGDNYSPKNTADVIDNALFSKNTKIVRGNEPQLQIAYDAQNPANAAIIGKHRDTEDIYKDKYEKR